MRYPWAKIRAEYENGATIATLAHQFSISRRSIEIHKKREQWRKPQKMVAGNGRGDLEEITPVTAAEIMERHKRDWQRLKPLHDEAVETARTATTEEALQFARLVRTLADGLKIIIEGERLAWAIAPTDQPPEIPDEELELEIQRASERIARARRDGGSDHTLH